MMFIKSCLFGVCRNFFCGRVLMTIVCVCKQKVLPIQMKLVNFATLPFPTELDIQVRAYDLGFVGVCTVFLFVWLYVVSSYVLGT